MGGRVAGNRPGDLSDQPAGRLRYRARYSVSGAKSDATDAVLLANIVRTDPDVHRPLPADTDAAQAIRVLARAQQDAVWARQRSAIKSATCSKSSTQRRSWLLPTSTAG